MNSLSELLLIAADLDANFVYITIDKYNKRMVVGVEPPDGPKVILDSTFVMSNQITKKTVIDNLNYQVELNRKAEECAPKPNLP